MTRRGKLAITALLTPIAFLMALIALGSTAPGMQSRSTTNEGIIISYDERYFDSATNEWGSTSAIWTVTAFSPDVVRAEKRTTSGKPMTTTFFVSDTLDIASWIVAGGGVIEQRRAVLEAGVPTFMIPLIEDVTGVPIVEAGNRVVRIDRPVVSSEDWDDMIASNQIDFVTTDTLLGIPASRYRVTGEKLGSRQMDVAYDVWVDVEDKLVLRVDFLDGGTTPVVRWDATALQKNVNLRSDDLVVHIEHDALLDDLAVKSYTPSAIAALDADLGGAASLANFEEVRVPGGALGGGYYSPSAASLITASMALNPNDALGEVDPELGRSGWMVAFEISGGAGENVVVIQAPTGRMLPIDIGPYWPEDVEIVRGYESLGEAKHIYSSVVESLPGKDDVLRIHTSLDAGEPGLYDDESHFEFVVETVLDQSVRAMFLANGIQLGNLEDLIVELLGDE